MREREKIDAIHCLSMYTRGRFSLAKDRNRDESERSRLKKLWCSRLIDGQQLVAELQIQKQEEEEEEEEEGKNSHSLTDIHLSCSFVFLSFPDHRHHHYFNR